jgi:hypothetical protein
MLRRVEEISHRAMLDDPAGIHHRHPVAHPCDDAEVVGDEPILFMAVRGRRNITYREQA